MARAGKAKRTAAGGYLERTHRPLNCLVFILPLLVAYEVASLVYPDRLLAPQHLEAILGLFGARGRFLPALLIVLVLLIWHVAAKETWHVDGDAVGGMAAESLLWWLPLLAMNLLTVRLMGPAPPAETMASALAAGGDADVALAAMILRGIGSGIYEEFVFRLGAISLILFVTVDVLRGPKKYMAPVAVVVASVAFGLYHYWGGQASNFDWHMFMFRIVAAAYLSVVYIARGFGVAVGAHACFNVALVLLTPGG